mgnify:CR=1 FL=1
MQDNLPTDLMILGHDCQAGNLDNKDLISIIYSDWYFLTNSRNGEAIAVSLFEVGEIPGLLHLDDTQFDLKNCEIKKVNNFGKRWTNNGQWWADMVEF